MANKIEEDGDSAQRNQRSQRKGNNRFEGSGEGPDVLLGGKRQSSGVSDEERARRRQYYCSRIFRPTNNKEIFEIWKEEEAMICAEINFLCNL